MKKFIQLIKREFRLFFSNKVLRLLFIGAPILYGVLIGGVYHKGKITDLPVIVVDQDHSPMSTKFIDMLEESESVEVAAVRPSLFGVKDKAIDLEATVIIDIPKGFAAGIQQNRLPEITLFVDASNTLTSNTALMAVNTVAMTMKAGIQIESQMKKGVPQYIASHNYEPFKTTIIKQSIRSGNYLFFMLPGVLLTVFQQILLLGLALSFASEYENETFTELVEKMPNPFGMLAVKIVPYLIMSVGIILLYWAFSKYYNMVIGGAFWAFMLSTLVFVLAVSGIGVLVSIVLPNQLKATEVLMVVATPSFILSGFTWPLSQMPVWVQSIADLIPLTHYLKIFRLLYLNHAEFHHIKTPLITMALIAVVCLSASAIILYFKIRKTKRLLKASQ
ncbi:ABC transporter permease [Aequorivita marina]|uniref:ABC transporter permease n=1 Tax=Aequorivita marina TaxID=3073654 RepID=UPI002876F084|nr:ABC transporter permease [Aequorivita sp. S2608]MDS1299734.1 ABC transporter permease [Aequorivita sp. S2608]